jgi:TolB-like protein/class 3 adenylate cyclase
MSAQEVKRKLTAILSADVEGYSRLMGEDEESTVRTLTAYREIMSSLIQQYRGRVVDSPGDNLLAEFSSVVDAVQCGVEIQQVLKARNAGLSESRRMEFRIGVNLGDVIEEGERIYGDGVNIAARVEGLAEKGSICISGSAYEQIKNKLALGYEYLGEHEVKNIVEPVRVYKAQIEPVAQRKEKTAGLRGWQWAAVTVLTVLVLGAGAVAVWKFYLHPSPPTVEVDYEEKIIPSETDKPSLAVLPFVNVGGDPEQEYFSDGMCDDLITDLSKISGLFVIARNSVFRYKGKPVDVKKVSRELGVRYVLEGSVRKAGGQVRINANLIDATTAGHLWSERYDGELSDVFALQDKITQKIVTALAVQLTSSEQEQITKKETEKITAYDSFLKARAHYFRHTPEDFAKALSYFENTIETDPNYRRAYFFMALIYSKASKLGKRWLDALDLKNAVVADGQAKKYLELSKSKIVFITSAKYTGNLGGVAGADAKCQQLAEGAGLPGTYKAWLSDKTSSPAATFTRWNGLYVLVDGTEVASNWLGLTEHFHLVPIKITETGLDAGESLVWTNTAPSGGPGPGPVTKEYFKSLWGPQWGSGYPPEVRDGGCQNWTSSNGDLYDGRTGNSSAQTTPWTYFPLAQIADCNELLRLYCFQQ